MTTHLAIKAKRPGYRRAGRAFSDKDAEFVALKDLKKGQEEQLRNDPHLLVTDSDGPEEPAQAPDASAAAKGKKKADQ